MKIKRFKRISLSTMIIALLMCLALLLVSRQVSAVPDGLNPHDHSGIHENIEFAQGNSDFEIFFVRVMAVGPYYSDPQPVSGVTIKAEIGPCVYYFATHHWNDIQTKYKTTDADGYARFYTYDLSDVIPGQLKKFLAFVTLPKSEIDAKPGYYGVEQFQVAYYDFYVHDSSNHDWYDSRPGAGGTESSRNVTFLLMKGNPGVTYQYNLNFLFLHGLGDVGSSFNLLDSQMQNLVKNLNSGFVANWQSSKPSLAYYDPPDSRDGYYGNKSTTEWQGEIRDHIEYNFNKSDLVIVAHSAGARATTRFLNTDWGEPDVRPLVRGVFTLNAVQDHLCTYDLSYVPVIGTLEDLMRRNYSDELTDDLFQGDDTGNLSIADWKNLGNRWFFSLGSGEDVPDGAACNDPWFNLLDAYSNDVDDQTVPLAAMDHFQASWDRESVGSGPLGNLIEYGVTDYRYDDDAYKFDHNCFREAANLRARTTIASFILSRTLPFFEETLPCVTLTHPLDGKGCSSTPDFIWTSLAPSIFYELQVTSYADPNFNSPIFIETGLTSISYQLPSINALSEGKYRWRVRASDGFGALSPWTASSWFFVIPYHTAGQDFWAVWPPTPSQSAEIAALATCPATCPAHVTVESPGNMPNQYGTASLGSPYICKLDDYSSLMCSYGDGLNDGVKNNAIHITSTEPVTILFRTISGPGDKHDDTYLVLPTTSLGSEYYALSYEYYTNCSYYVVIATDDGTEVNWANWPGLEQNTTLDKWQTLTVSCNVGMPQSAPP
jgi:hypothetical protein